MKDVEVKSNVEKLELYSSTHPFNLSLRIKTFESETDYIKFIKNVEKLVRGSIEYKLYKGYIIDVLRNSSCFITNESMDECSIEVHHHIPSLFMLVKSVINKEIAEDKTFSTFDIALETMKLHFLNKVGYVILVTSMHEKLHNGFLNVPLSLVKGDYKYFIDNYSKYLDEEDLNQITERLAINESNCSWERNNYPSLENIING
jgi:hypothetical protein